MADSDEFSWWQYLKQLSCVWLGLCVGICLGWSLTYWPAIRNNPLMPFIAWPVLVTVGAIPRGILATIDQIRGIRQKNKAAAAWRDKPSQ